MRDDQRKVRTGLANTLDETHERLLRLALRKTAGSPSQTAERIQVSRATVYRWMRKYGIGLDEYRS